MSGQPADFDVGTYAEKGGAGLYRIGRDGHGTWRVGAPATNAHNASFGVRSKRHGLTYLVDEQGGRIGAYRVVDNRWEQVAELPTQGALPCHLAMDAQESCLAVANYGSGSLCFFRLGFDGVPLEPPVVHANHGRGADPERQEGPHAHWVGFSPDGNWLFQTDLGTDQVRAFPFDPDACALEEVRVAFSAPKGSGPRHLAFHPRLRVAYLVSELASTVTVFDLGDGDLSARQMLSSLPNGYDEKSLGGHIGLNAAGDRLYVTNRGHDSVAVFAVDGNGSLTPMRWVPSRGASPRFFILDEQARRMLVAHEESGNVVVFDLAADGVPAHTGVSLDIPGAVFIAPAP